MGEAQDGIFEGAEVVDGHASKNVDVAGFDGGFEEGVFPVLQLVVGVVAAWAMLLPATQGTRAAGGTGSNHWAGAISML